MLLTNFLHMGYIIDNINLVSPNRIMLSYSLAMVFHTINGLICSPSLGHECINSESSRVLMRRSGEDLEMSATFTSSRTAAQPATSTLVAAPSFVMIPTATGQFVQPVILPAQVGGPMMINGQLTAAPQQLLTGAQGLGNNGVGVPRRRVRVIRPGGGGRRGRIRGAGGGMGRGRRFRRLRGGRGGRGGGGGRSAPIVIVDNGGQQGQGMSQQLIQPMVQPIIQPVIQPMVQQQPFIGNPLVQSNPPSIQVPSLSVTTQPPAPTFYQTPVTSVQDNKVKNIGNPTVFVPAAPVVNLMMIPSVTAKPGRKESLRDRRRNRVRSRVKLRLKEWVNTE